MDAKSNYLEDAVLNAVLRNTAYTSPVTVYVALYNVAPSEGGGGTEVSGVNYARQAVTFAAPVTGSTSNDAPVSFPAAGAGGWGSVVAAAIHDDPVAGNLLYYGDLAAPKTVDAGDTVTFAIAALTVTES